MLQKLGHLADTHELGKPAKLTGLTEGYHWILSELLIAHCAEHKGVINPAILLTATESADSSTRLVKWYHFGFDYF